tara:strand:+ start:266 stop:1204 length:939 start_codon:yes stop_codon:yes gene_type:complete
MKWTLLKLTFVTALLFCFSCGQMKSKRSSENKTTSRPFLVKGKGELVGIKNIGNTCFINALLQLLFHSKPFETLFQKINLQNNSLSAEESLVEALRKTYFNYKQQENGKAISPYDFRDWLSKNFISNDGPAFKKGQQNCSRDLFTSLLASISEVIPEGFNDLRNQYLLQGQDEPLLLLREQQIENAKDVKDALEAYIKQTSLETRLPNYLMLSLVREGYSIKEAKTSYNKKEINFSQVLEVKLEEESKKYNLEAIICKSGKTKSGHYWSYVKIKNKWYEFNDSSVSEVSFTKILSKEKSNVVMFSYSSELNN